MKRFLKWLSDLFSSPSKPTEPVIVEAPKKEEPSPKLPSGKKKIAILVGHGAGDPGATCWNGMAEHFFNSEASKNLPIDVKNNEIKLFFKRKGTGWATVYAEAKAWGAVMTVEIHLNAASGKAFGTEAWITSEKSRAMAELFAKRFAEKFKRKLRGEKGVKVAKNGDRAFKNVYFATMHIGKSMLVEPFFCDNKEEWISIEDYKIFLTEFFNEL